jgi:TM2 domain-containing membrane protein YozV
VDSINYYKAWSKYCLKDLENSADDFTKVSIQSSFYSKSKLFASYNLAHISEYRRSISILNQYSPETNSLSDMKNYMKAGINLLEKKYESFDSIISGINKDYYIYSKELKKIKSYRIRMQKHKGPSPFLAGLFSAIVPGSGKIYAGKTGEGISSLISVGALGLVSLENYNKLGFNNYRTIIFSSIFSIFYIGNIYGSVFTAKIVNDEFNNEMQQKILFNIHIPLRNFFN